MNKYFAGRNATFNDAKAASYGAALEKIQERCKGFLTPEEVVHSAKSKSNPLHNIFNWDDKAAAFNYRKQQARQLLRTIVIRQTINNELVDVPAFSNVVLEVGDKKKPEKIRVYLSEDTIRSSRELHEQTLADAVRRLEFWNNRFGTLKELAEVSAVIQKTLKGYT